MADDSQAYTPEELAALESVADMLSPAECQRLIHQLRQQTARAEAAERERDEARDEAADRKRLCDSMSEDVWEAAAFYRCATCTHEQREHCHARGPDERACCTCDCAQYVSDGQGLAPLVAERDAARTALAAAEVERARLFGSLAWLVEHVTYWEDSEGEPVEENDPGAIAGCVSCIDSSECAYQQARKVLITSPHADLAAVRAVVKAAQDVQRDRECAKEWPMATDAQVPWHSITRLVQSLDGLPSWCREQP